MKRVLGITLLALVSCTCAACVNSSAAHQPVQVPGAAEPAPAQSPVSQPADSTRSPSPAPIQEHGTKLIAFDTSDAGKTEELARWTAELFPIGLSPDGRYVLFYGSPTDAAVTPYLLDRTANQLHAGKPLSMNLGGVAWSGHGFWVDTLVNLDPTLQLKTYPQLRQALGVTVDTQLVAASVSADGTRVAALVGPARIDATAGSLSLDLVLARADGSGVVRVAKAVQPWFTQNGPRALIALSPDGTRLAIAAESPRSALVDTAHPHRADWQAPGHVAIGEPVPAEKHTSPPGPRPLWAPDGKHMWMPMEGIVTPDGSVISAASARGWGLAWRPDGSEILLGSPDGGYALADLRGGAKNLAIPEGVQPIGYLRDGRMLAAWKDVKPSPKPAPASSQFNLVPYAISFWDEQKGLLTGQSGCPVQCGAYIIALTQDGGRHWKKVYQGPERISKLAVIPGGAWASTGNGLLESVDGGETWQTATPGYAEPTFSGVSNGWALKAIDGNRWNEEDPIYATQDGGRNWTPINSPCPEEHMTPGAISLVSDDEGWVACFGQPGAGQQAKTLYTTTDGGKTWRKAADLGGGGYLNGLSFRPGGKGWVWLSRGGLRATTDGGKTWKWVDTVLPDTREAWDVSMVSDQSGYLLLNDNEERKFKLIKTTDAGASVSLVMEWPVDPPR